MLFDLDMDIFCGCLFFVENKCLVCFLELNMIVLILNFVYSILFEFVVRYKGFLYFLKVFFVKLELFNRLMFLFILE